MTVGKRENGAVDVRPGELGVSAKGVKVVHGTFRCRRGYDLHTATYLPAVRRTTACLVFHHGLSDHHERHGAVLTHLCATLGMPVYTYDAHGHGRSGPHGPAARALVRTYRHLVDDLLDFTRLFVTREEELEEKEEDGGADAAAAASVSASSGDSAPGNDAHVDGGGQPRSKRQRRPRIFLMGYSMGGLVSNLAVAETCPASSSSPSAAAAAAGTGTAHTNGSECSSLVAAAMAAGTTGGDSAAAAESAGVDGGAGSSLFAGLMLTSSLTDPFYGNHPVLRAVKVAYVTALSWMAPALPMFKRNPVESGIRDPAAAAAMADDTLWYRGRFKVATVASLLYGCARLRAIARRMSCVPFYVQHATVDVSCSLPSMQAHLARVRPRDLTMHVVEGAYHDLHHDPETPMLLGRMVEWLAKRA
ncbi:hypothetical protein PLESTB_000401600 [Pleodorina starrii]|uniref:Serine aminopeptidase S33 domain-containing protein n=1 Tax=Pleodorina starrii TaxID=330485 RepID=A0A9W6BEG1_9CHLO|nr:hypothetical protein PLESTM_001497000 [Pleodorina starrii]GLC50634.1 hypothetical protein PLESTB_000401600 [Pleodorina starrii]GLC75247.1 hypothetical protein PLESTF_001613100 [Pleodorina starrii]